MTAYLYTWGEGRVTSEGESIAVRTEELEIGYIDGMLCAPCQACMLWIALRACQHLQLGLMWLIQRKRVAKQQDWRADGVLLASWWCNTLHCLA